jgi:hypothetical protein
MFEKKLLFSSAYVDSMYTEGCVHINVKYSHVCVTGGPNQPLHRDPQWSIVLLNIVIVFL